MQWFESLRVRSKLLISFTAMAVVAGAIGTVGVLGIQEVAEHDRMIVEDVVTPMAALGHVRENFQAVLVHTRESLMVKDRSASRETVRTALEHQREMEADAQELEHAIVDEDLKRRHEAFSIALAAYTPVLREILDLAADRREQAAALLEQRGVDLAEDVEASLEDLTSEMQSHAAESALRNAAIARRSTVTMIVTLVFGVAAALLFSMILTKVIAGPMARLVAVIGELGRGHLNERVRLNRTDEIGLLAETMDRFAEDLQKNVVGRMQRISEGDLTGRIEAKDHQDEIAPALQRTIQALQGLVAEATGLARGAVEGRLSTRGDASRFQGSYREIIAGFNQTLDAVVRPIQEAQSVLERVADRDLSARMTGSYQGDHARLQDALNQAVANLDQALLQVSAAVDQVTAAANEIGTGSQSLAQGASTQASSLEEVGSSLQEMTSMTRQSAGSAKEARGLAESARAGAARGLEGMNQLSQAIERIKASSDATARIVKTIDEIAFQTNLLALNAAVEAARAGDAGKGFAVVAEEVRNLAMRSAEAAKNTANLIEESVKNSEDGVALNDEVLNRLREITGQAERVGTVVAEISVGSEQQAEGIGQITTTVDQMSSVTQQTAANAEEAASAAEELSGQAEELRGLVSGFHLTEAHRATASRRPPITRQTAGATPCRREPAGVGPRKAPAGALPGKGATTGKARPAPAARGKAKLRMVPPPEADPQKVIPFDDDEDDRTVLNSF